MLSLKILLLIIIIFVLVLLNNNNKPLSSNIDNFKINYVDSLAINNSNNDKLDNDKLDNDKLENDKLENDKLDNNKSVIIGDSNFRDNPFVIYDDLIYYDNDTINQSNIIETAYDVVNMIDLVDYSKVKTGMEKCKDKHGNDGVCFEGGYTGTATYFPKMKHFDYGTLYKNPMFINGISN
jgi:hypothetical protein